MEEILASIRRIIEDNDAGRAPEKLLGVLRATKGGALDGVAGGGRLDVRLSC